MDLHFIYTGGDFSYPYYLAIVSALKTQKVDSVKLWHTERLQGRYFEKIRDRVELLNADVPDFPALKNKETRFKNTHIKDYLTWKILYDHGGICMDLDTFSLKDISLLLGDKSIVAPIDVPKIEDCPYPFNSAIVVAVRHSPVIAAVLTRVEGKLAGKDVKWGETGPIAFSDVVKSNLDAGVIVPEFGTCGGFGGHEILDLYKETGTLRPNARVVHLFAYASGNLFNNIDERYIDKGNTLLARLVKETLTKEEWDTRPELHFINTGLTFPYPYYLSLMSAIKTQNASQINLWLVKEPSGPYYDAVKDKVKVTKLGEDIPDFPVLRYPNPDHPERKENFANSHLVDYYRWQILWRYGGIAADMDSLFIKDCCDLIDAKLWQEGKEFLVPAVYEDWEHVDSNTRPFHNAIFAGRKRSLIMQWIYEDCHRRMMKDDNFVWGDSGPHILNEYAKAYPTSTEVVEYGVLGGNLEMYQLFDEKGKLPDNQRFIHLWAQSIDGYWPAINESYIEESNHLYAKMVRSVLGIEERMPDIDKLISGIGRERLVYEENAAGYPMYLFADEKYLTPMIKQDHVWEPEVTNFVKNNLKTGQVFVDVGAHNGYYTIIASKIVGDEGKVLAFEPCALNRSLLELNLRLNKCNNVFVSPLALSNVSGEAKLYAAPPCSYGQRSITNEWKTEGYDVVKTAPLDEVMLYKPDMVKIDVDGAAELVVEGMVKTLARNPRVYIALEDITGKALELLKKQGFSVTSQGPANYDYQLLKQPLDLEGFINAKGQHYRPIFQYLRTHPCRSIMEIGTYDGGNAVQMIKAAAGKVPESDIVYYGFDLFEDMTPEMINKEYSYPKPPAVEKVQAMIEGQTQAKAVLIKGDTRKTLPQRLDLATVVQMRTEPLPKMDLIYIDGGHSLETVASDWLNVIPLIGPDTVVFFDDYLPEMPFIGCRATVDGIDKDKYAVDIPQAYDDYPKEYGRMRIQLAEVRMKREHTNKTGKPALHILGLAHTKTDPAYNACFSDDTEVMTEDGWKPLKGVVEEKIPVKVATLNQSTGMVEYQLPTHYHKYSYDGKMFHQGGQSIDLMTTPDHMLWLRTAQEMKMGKPYHFVVANEIRRVVQYQRDFPWEDAKEPEGSFILPAYDSNMIHRSPKSIPWNDWLSLFGIYVSEGNVGYNKFKSSSSRASAGGIIKRPYSICIAQEISVNRIKIMCLLEKMGFNFHVGPQGFIIGDAQLAAFLETFGHAAGKYIPLEYKRLPKIYLQNLLDWLVMGDGQNLDNGMIRYFTYSKQLADDVGEIGLKLGYTVTQWGGNGNVDKHGKRPRRYSVSLSKRSMGGMPNQRKNREAFEDYKGFVYCLTVKNATLYVRRNGKGCWAGNCAYSMKVLKLSKMMKKLGYEVYHYGAEGSNPDCTEHITVVSTEIQRQTYGDYDWHKEMFKHNPTDLAYKTFNQNAIREINLRKSPQDLLLISMGNYQKPISDAVGLTAVETGIGYSGVYTNRRVFESVEWMHFIYGILDPTRGNADGSYYDCVIPNYWDPQDFEFSAQKDDYYLYLGRLIPRKGLNIAAQCCERIGARLVIAGQGTEDTLKELGIDAKKVEFVGYADVKKRSDLMAHAKAIFVPTLYIEPLGGSSIEAYFAGTPSITTDFGGFRSSNQHGKTGFRCHTMAEFVWAAKNVDKLDPYYIREYAEKNYSMDRVALMYDHYFQMLADLWKGGWYEPHPEPSFNLDWLNRY